MGQAVEATLSRLRPKRAWWKLLLEGLFVLWMVAYNVSLALNDVATDPKLRAIPWVKPAGVIFTTVVATLWALLLLWIGRSFWRRLRREYHSS